MILPDDKYRQHMLHLEIHQGTHIHPERNSSCASPLIKRKNCLANIIAQIQRQLHPD
jgi:hypothetical protein